MSCGSSSSASLQREREFFIDDLLVRVHFIIVMIRWTGLLRVQLVREPADERMFVELMTSDRKLKAFREGSKGRKYGT